MRPLLLFLLVFLFFVGASSHLYQSEKVKDKCEACLLEFKLIDQLIEENQTEAVILNATTALCVFLGIENYPVCYGIIVNEYGHNVIRIFLNTELSPEDVCKTIRVCDKTKPLPDVDDELNRFRQVNHLTKRSSSNVGYFVQITDMHYDPLYRPGTNVDCGEPLCCREDDGPGDSNRWGNYQCDLSPDMLQSYLAAIGALSNDIDFIVWTGDNPPHNIWEQSPAQQLNSTQILVEALSQTFGSLPIYPSIGNHECYPADQFMNPWTSWLNDGLANMWSLWLPGDAIEQVKEAIYYTTLISPGFRLVSLNTQYSDLYNFYNLYDQPNMDNHTTWLIDTLTSAESAGEKVLIIGHIPCSHNSNVYNGYCSEYGAIVSRFNQTIVGQLYGHTHTDQYVVVTNNVTGEPSGTIFIAPSATTYKGHNPSFRIFAYDRTTFEILDYVQYIVNLTQAIIDDSPTFFEFYSALEAYNLPDLSPNTMYQLYKDMTVNQTLFNEYYYRYYTGASTTSCTGECEEQMLCDIGTYTDEGYKACIKSSGLGKD
eukprot:TRINITY_DN1838_c0_g1_i1.p1 TRINITY_DN1838_c0_g1~~TRINITY_DN1838_c0_g1_i1.p1  ORF type:complete len:540 (-),score=70.89 TRINITY_DN1838_c0_g1_i1:79-1698(-)